MGHSKSISKREIQAPSQKVNAKNLIHSHLPWAPAEGGQSGLDTNEERQVTLIVGRELKKQLP